MQPNISVEVLLWYLWVGGGHIVAALFCGWAFWKGGKPEKIGAAIIGVGWVISPLIVNWEKGYGIGIASVDFMASAMLILLALWSRLNWTFFAAAVMVNAFMGQIAHHFTDFTIHSYQTAVTFWGGWGLLLCLAYGVHSHQKHQAKLNPKPAP